VGIINSEVTRQSFMLSVAEIYKISAFLFIVLIGVVWFARPKKMQAKAPAAGH
jgi:DHA2 family multidrug resistance protein